jgi:hypothetical protein
MNSSLPCKTVGVHKYYHKHVVGNLDPALIEKITTAENIANLTSGDQYNVVKLSEINPSITFLDYRGFFEEAFPVLANHWTVYPEGGTFRHRNYETSLNPPILHRKELLLEKDHPQQNEFQALTAAAEQIGLFDNPMHMAARPTAASRPSHARLPEPHGPGHSSSD